MFASPTSEVDKIYRYCPNPTTMTDTDLVQRMEAGKRRSEALSAGALFGLATLPIGLSRNSPVLAATGFVVASAFGWAARRQNNVADAAHEVLQNRARLGSQSIFKYEGPGR